MSAQVGIEKIVSAIAMMSGQTTLGIMASRVENGLTQCIES